MNSIPFEIFENKRIREQYKKYSHPSGLDIYIFPKKMTATYAIFGTKYGSIHNCFKYDGDKEWTTVPDGIAHFLEHKLFVCEDGSDAFERFSDYGADANAYTSFNKTCYLFSCTERFADSLGELLEFVTHPYFTKESVENEIGIIAEEIKMYDDNPSDRCFYGMLEGMYKEHSVRRNICGTKASISKITPELLYDCYERFYRHDNMALIICGDITDDEVLEIANRHLPKDPIKSLPVICRNENEKESAEVFMPYVEQRMQVSKPIFKIGIKDTDIPESASERQRKEAKMAILNEMIFSGSMDLYAKLIEKDMISPAFSYGYTICDSFAYNGVSGESDDPQEVLDEILAHIDELRKNGLCYADFLRSKRVMYAEAVKSYDSVDNIANNLFGFVCDGFELLSDTDIIDSITFEEICELFECAFNRKSITLSSVIPL